MLYYWKVLLSVESPNTTESNKLVCNRCAPENGLAHIVTAEDLQIASDVRTESYSDKRRLPFSILRCVATASLSAAISIGIVPIGFSLWPQNEPLSENSDRPEEAAAQYDLCSAVTFARLQPEHVYRSINTNKPFCCCSRLCRRRHRSLLHACLPNVTLHQFCVRVLRATAKWDLSLSSSNSLVYIGTVCLCARVCFGVRFSPLFIPISTVSNLKRIEMFTNAIKNTHVCCLAACTPLCVCANMCIDRDMERATAHRDTAKTATSSTLPSTALMLSADSEKHNNGHTLCLNSE